MAPTVANEVGGQVPALAARGLTQAYRDRPACQKNDYIGWITRDKRLAQMLDELAAGGVYMKMKHAASAKS
ncbi:MAG: hypothetical protein QM569_06690 [Acidovorax sp.]|uniref:hypothetical protein n=1 Tax=Acidovorax sp. TaxID=1872122 RepID=UPI0039E3FDBF